MNTNQNKGLIIGLTCIIVVLIIGLVFAIDFGHYGGGYVKVTTHNPEGYLDSNSSDFTITNDPTKSIDLTLQNDPQTPYLIMNGQKYYVGISELESVISQAKQPYFYGHDLSFTFPAGDATKETFSLLVYNPLKTDITVAFGIDSQDSDWFILPDASTLESGAFQLFTFEENIPSLVFTPITGRIFFDYYQYGKKINRVYYNGDEK